VFAGGIAGAALTTGSLVWLAVEQTAGPDWTGIGYMLGGLAAVITAPGGLVLAFRKPRKDPAEELLLKLLADKAGVDLEDTS